MGIVPEPQKGSIRLYHGSQWERMIIAAARVSLRGASPMKVR